MATVSIPLLLKDVTGGTRNAEVDGTTLAEVIDALDQTFPGFAHRVLNGDQLSPTVAVTVDGKIAAGGLSTPVCPDSRVNLLPAFGGG